MTIYALSGSAVILNLSTRVNLRRLAGFLIFTFLLLSWVGCRTQKPAQPRDIVSGQAQAGEKPQNLKQIRFLPKWLHQAQFAGIYMASAKGFYRDRGLDVEIQYGGPNHPPYPSLVAGDTDITYLNLVTALTVSDPQRPLVNLAQIFQKNATLLLGKKSAQLNSLNDLKGKRIGVWRGESGDQVRLLLQAMGIDAEVVPIDWSVNLLLNDAIDLMNVMHYNEYHRVLMAGLDPQELFVLDFADYGYDLVDDGLYATQDFYLANTQTCKDFAEATMDGWLYALDHPEETVNETVRIMRQYHLPANRSHQRWMLNSIRALVLAHPGGVGYLNKADFDKVQELLLTYQPNHPRVDYQSFYPHAIQKRK